MERLSHARRASRTNAIALTLALLVGALLLPGMAAAREGPTIDAWPLLELGDDTTTILYPLYSQTGDSITAFPFYYRTNEGRDHHVLWPLVKVSDGKLERVAPLLYMGDNEFTLLPLIRQTKDSTWLVVPPIYWRHDGSFKAVLPLYVGTDEATWLFVPPVYWRHDGSFKMIFPLYAGGERGHFVAPSIYFRTDQDGGLDRLTAWPLFHYREQSQGTAGRFNFALIARNEWNGDERKHVLFPLGGFRAGSAHDDFVWVGPYYQDEQNLTVFPFYSGGHKELGGGRERKTMHVLWPVYQREDVVTASGERESSKRRFLFFTDDRRANGTRVFSMMGLPVRETVEE